MGLVSNAGAKPRCRLRVDAEVFFERDAVILAGRFKRYVAANYVLVHPLGVSLARIAPAAAAGKIHG